MNYAENHVSNCSQVYPCEASTVLQWRANCASGRAEAGRTSHSQICRSRGSAVESEDFPFTFPTSDPPLSRMRMVQHLKVRQMPGREE